MQLSIRWKMIFSIALPLVVIATVVVGLTLDLLYKRARDTLHDSGTTLAKHYAARMDGQFQSFAQVAKSTAAFLEVHPDISEEQLYQLLRANVAQNPLIYGSAIAFEPNQYQEDLELFSPYVYQDKNGVHSIDVATESYDYSNGEWEWFSKPRELGHGIWTEPFFDEGAGNILMVTHSVPFYRDKEFRGVATVDIPLKQLQKHIGIDQLEDQPFAIVSNTGRFITHPNPDFIMKSTLHQQIRNLNDQNTMSFADNVLAGKSGISIVPDVNLSGLDDIGNLWVFYAPIVSTGWSFITSIPESIMTESVRANLGLGALGGLIMVLLVIISILIISTNLTRPITRLATAVSRLGEGKLDTRVSEIKSTDEIGQLSTGFNRMVDQLNNHIDALTKETAARESVESELRVAREIQSSLLPHMFPPFPDYEEFDLHAVNLAARHVAGDFFDFFFINDDKLIFVIADVSGKGVPAAMVMAVTRTIIRNLAHTGQSPAAILKETNKLLIETHSQPIFVTIIIACYNISSGKLIYSNAGHHPPYRVDALGNLNQFGPASGTIVGMLDDISFQDEETVIQRGETLVLYTDGLPEGRSPDGKFYSDVLFQQLLRSNAGRSTKEICDLAIQEVTTFQAGELSDDVTIMVFRRNS